MKFDPVFLLENAAWPAFLVEGSGTICRANQAARHFFGPTVADASASLIPIWGEENNLSVEEFLARGKQAAAATAPLKLRGKGDAILAFTACLCPIDNEGQPGYVLQLLPPAPAPDRSHPANDNGPAQKQKLDCARQLARTVALDFNNALTSILGHASFILAQMEPDHPWRPALAEVEKASEKATDIVQQLAAFSRVEKESAGVTSGNLNALLRRLVDVFPVAPKSIEWSWKCEPQLHSAQVDEAKIHQALAKILENAAEAITDRGTIRILTRNLEITEATQDRSAHLKPGNYVCAEIADEGEGIEPEALPRIFEPFFTTKRGHRGLGLAWVYGIITNHGGSVAVSSQPQQGTSVRVYLPSTRKLVLDTGQANDDLNGTGTVLIVDDEELLLTLGQRVLTAHGYTVRTAGNGPQALQVLDRAAPAPGHAPVDLVITDLVMPGMSGRELMAQIRQIAPDLPIICTSGYVRPGHADDQARYLQKPFTSQDLLRHVKKALSDKVIT